MNRWILIISFLFLWPTLAMAQTSPLDGTWSVSAALGAPGVFTEDAYNQAERAIGRNIIVTERDVTLYNGLKCDITGAQSKVVTDYDFGRNGGSWREIGLAPMTGETFKYKVVEIRMTCPNANPDQQQDRIIMVANSGTLFVLNFWETWARLDRVEAQ